jgi:UDP-glucose 4-epimerase
MTILVTGGTGYIVSHMVLALAGAGERAVLLDNLSTGFGWAVAEGVPCYCAASEGRRGRSRDCPGEC